MNIVQVIPEFGLAGAEIMCENLTYELIKQGHEVTVISMYDYHSAITDRLENAGVCIKYLDKKSGMDFSMIRKMKKIFKEVDAEVIHTHLYASEYAIFAAMRAGIKHRVHTVHTIAEKENGKLGRKLNKFFFKHCNTIPVALSELIQDTIAKEYCLSKQSIPVIFNGIDLSKCIVKENYESCENFKILHIGRFSGEKNHAGLLEAFRLFHEKHTNTELWLIGDGEKKSEAEEYVQNNSLGECVQFLGLQSNVYGFLHDADMFTLPSNYEGIPMTLIEAMGTGLPIVATAVGGVPDMLTNNENALLVDNTIDLIVQAFEKYYLDVELRKQHGQKAKERATDFSAKTMAEEYVKIYQIEAK